MRTRGMDGDRPEMSGTGVAAGVEEAVEPVPAPTRGSRWNMAARVLFVVVAGLLTLGAVMLLQSAPGAAAAYGVGALAAVYLSARPLVLFHRQPGGGSVLRSIGDAVVLPLVVLALTLVVGRAIAGSSSGLEAAADACSVGLNISDDGGTLVLDTDGTDDRVVIGQWATMKDVDCVLDELGAPSAVRSHMEATRAIDGQQTEEWDGVSARWTYHPRSGLVLILRST